MTYVLSASDFEMVLLSRISCNLKKKILNMENYTFADYHTSAVHGIKCSCWLADYGLLEKEIMICLLPLVPATNH